MTRGTRTHVCNNNDHDDDDDDDDDATVQTDIRASCFVCARARETETGRIKSKPRLVGWLVRRQSALRLSPIE
jgi:hypothetical protein